MRWWWLATGLVALLGVFARHAPASSQSLTEALAEAYRTNPQLLAQRALLRATDELVPQALANWRPTVTVTGRATHSSSGQSNCLSGSAPALNMSQPVYSGGRTVAQTQQAIDTVEAARAQTLEVETVV